MRLERRIIVYPGEHRYELRGGIEVMPLQALARELYSQQLARLQPCSPL